MAGTAVERYVEQVANATSYACLHFTDTRNRPVLLRAVSGPYPWQWPGGTMEHGETPWQCALRECQEETGIAFSGPRRLLAVSFALPGPAWPRSNVGFIFDGGTLTDQQLDAITLDPREHSDLASHPLPDWEPLMDAESMRLLRAADAARRTETVTYLE
ncbi:NUDIX hydrolase [Streptomyces sp. NPDC089919]|uniref:NUDIX hydrolase n=1 Tax=Streptomyces sp. NPDC089919 TaxID=3155188 RepID=UPI003421E63A